MLSDAGLARLAAIELSTLPQVSVERIGAWRAASGQVHLRRLNYADHAKETGKAPPDEPILFMKATSAVVGPNDEVEIPRGSKKADWEVELGVVIGTRAKYVSEADALNHVVGYCVVNDVSERAFQTERQGQWTKGKSCDTFGPIGPWLVTKDEIADPQNLGMWLKVNGETMQNGSSKTMVYGVAKCRVLSQPVHVSASGRCHLHRHASGCRSRHEATALPESRRCGRAWH